jgi:hypothetical protein
MSDTFQGEPAKRGPGRPPNSERPPMRTEPLRTPLHERLRGAVRSFKTSDDRHEISEEIKRRARNIRSISPA